MTSRRNYDTLTSDDYIILPYTTLHYATLKQRHEYEQCNHPTG